jgi:Fic family protein
MTAYSRFKDICLSTKHYPTITELIYKYGFKREDTELIKQSKLQDEEFVKIGLHDEFGNELIYWNHRDMILKFSDSQDLIKNSRLNDFSDFTDSEIINGFVFSEIESSLLIEGVRSTRTRIEQINKADYSELEDQNDIIVKNMLLAYEFVKEKDITKESIHELYIILSNKCLKQDERLLDGHYYRHDEVSIVDSANAVIDHGIDWKLLPQYMDELMQYINKDKSYEEHLIASHIIHFYIVYLHPYFDYNGRMARVISFWYNRRYAPSLSLLLVSEAINNKGLKNDYYTAISNSRNTENDITYFLEYMSGIILKYTKVYINLYSILTELKTRGEILNRSTEIALKYVLSLPTSASGYFDWKDYKDFSHDDFSKQRHLVLLNTLAELHILHSKEVKKAKLFKLNQEDWDLLT